MRKWLHMVLPIAFILLTVGLMVSGFWLKEPMGQSDDVFGAFKSMEKLVVAEDWERAKKAHKRAEQAWDVVSNRIQFSVERESMLEIAASLARSKGGIESQDKQAVLSEIYYFYDLWDNLR